MKFRKLMIPLAASALIFSACGSQPAAEEPAEKPEETETAETETAEPQETPEAEAEDKTLVVYFSATGTTKGVAEKIAAIVSGDLYEITASEPYSEDDLNWHDDSSRTTHEQDDPSVRPAISSEPLDLTGYTTVFVGYPIWWGEEPRIMDTFVETYEFDGLTMIPFCTSGSSGIGRSGKNLEELAGSGTWLEGQRFSGSVSEADLKTWIDGLK